MKVLVVKTSSLGDIIHALPALSDAQAVYPNIRFDWVLEEPFVEIPRWHGAVDRVIPIAFRRFKKNPRALLKSGEWREWFKQIRAEHYDLVIDLQGLLKSAVLTRLVRADVRGGFSWTSARESVASLFYGKRVVVPKAQHAVMRNRALFAQILGYDISRCALNYGITQYPFVGVSLEEPYCVFLHGTTWDSKHWPEHYWCALAKKVAEAGYTIQLLWGNDLERARALRIAAVTPKAGVLPQKLSLSEVASLLIGAQAVVSVDTGFAHLATALNVPTVSLYGPTDPLRSGTLGEKQLSLGADFPCSPCLRRVCLYAGQQAIDPPCFVSVNPERVWKKLLPFLQYESVCASAIS